MVGYEPCIFTRVNEIYNAFTAIGHVERATSQHVISSRRVNLNLSYNNIQFSRDIMFFFDPRCTATDAVQDHGISSTAPQDSRIQSLLPAFYYIICLLLGILVGSIPTTSSLQQTTVDLLYIQRFQVITRAVAQMRDVLSTSLVLKNRGLFDIFVFFSYRTNKRGS